MIIQITIPLSRAAADTDNDMLPDYWELLHFGNLSQGPYDDPDHDGVNNIEEYLYETNPTVSGPNLLLNPSFEQNLTSWYIYGSNTIRVVDDGVDGSKSLYINNTNGTWWGAIQTISFDEPTILPFYFSYWIKATRIESGALASMDICIRYADGTLEYLISPFRPTADDIGSWVKKEWVFSPSKPVSSICVYCLNYYAQSTAYYDNLMIMQLNDNGNSDFTNEYTTLSINTLSYVTSLTYQGTEQLSTKMPLSTITFENGVTINSNKFYPIGNDVYELHYTSSNITVMLNITSNSTYYVFRLQEINNPEQEDISSLMLYQIYTSHIPQVDKAWAESAPDDALFFHSLPLTIDTLCRETGQQYLCRADKWLGFDDIVGVFLTTPKAEYNNAIEQVVLENLRLPYP